MRSKNFIIYINEATSFTDTAKSYSERLNNSIISKQEKIKEAQKAIKEREESDKDLETQTKESQRYNTEQITQKKAAYNVTKSPEEQKRIRLELIRLDTERKRIVDTLHDIQVDKKEFIDSKNEEIKDALESIKADQDMKSELDKTVKSSEKTSTEKVPAPQAQITSENLSEEDDVDKYGFMIKRRFARMEEQEEIKSKKKTLVVNFDKSTQTPFQVKFTERGFLIGETRLSFEFIEAALSKEVNIVLENGSGLVLDAIRMQKILKYKDRI